MSKEMISDRQYKAFQFKEFSLEHKIAPMKIGVDGILLGSWAEVENARHILDIGTGCGLIAMLLAQRNKKANIIGVEIDPATAEEAGENVRSSPWPSRITIVTNAIQDFALEARQEFDMIVSNPPFFTGGTLSLNENRLAVRHTTKLSHSDLFAAVRKLLSQEGSFSVILPYLEGRRFIEMVEAYGFHLKRLCHVHPTPGGKVERMLITLGRRRTEVEQESVTIRNLDGSFSDQYRRLTSDFYIE